MDTGSKLHGAPWGRAMALCAVVVTATTGVLCSIQQYADGSLFEYVMLRDSKIWVGHTRQEAHVLTQLPAYLGLKAGITSIPLLGTLLGLGMIALPAGCWFLALFLHRRTPWFWMLLGGWALSTLCSFAAFSEANLAYGLCALVLAVVVLPRSLRPGDLLILITAGLGLLATYESLVFLGPLLAAGCILRLRASDAEQSDAAWTRPWLVLASFLLAASAFIAVVQLATSSNPDGASSYLDLNTILTSGAYFQLLLTMALLTMAVLAGLSVRTHRALACSCGALGLLLVIPTWWAAPSVEFSSRVLVGGALFVLFGATLLLRFAARTDRVGRARLIPIVMSGLVIVSAIHLISLDLGFRTWRAHMTTAVRSHSGYVPFPESGLSRAEFNRYGWAWTNPVMSMLLMNARDQGVIGNPSPAWHPINPLKNGARLNARYFGH